MIKKFLIENMIRTSRRRKAVVIVTAISTCLKRSINHPSYKTTYDKLLEQI